MVSHDHDNDNEKSKSTLSDMARSLLGGKKVTPTDEEKPATETDPHIPQQYVLPIIPIREGILFPSTESVLTFGRDVSLNAIKESVRTKNMVLLLTQKKSSVDFPKPQDMFQIGTLAVIERTIKSDEQINALVRGVGRGQVVRYIRTSPSLMAQVVERKDDSTKDEEVSALAKHLQKEFRKSIHMGKPVEFLNFMKLMSGVTEGELVDQIASTLNIKTLEKQKILETLDVKKRLNMVIEHLSHEMRVMEIEKDVVSKTQEKFDKSMRENVLRERLRTIQKELGEVDDEEEVVQSYEQRLKKLTIGKDATEKIKKEIKRLRQMSVNNPEAGYVRTWLDTVFELPWGKTDATTVKIKEAETLLNKNHFGLKEVKERVLEYMAVLELKQKNKTKDDDYVPTILCFVGPPGVGKTSIGRSIAEALGRQFVKVSLGGVRDEAEIRGHRRTYVGAMPGRIVTGIKQAKSMNPVFMLDEVDKLGNDFRGDPSAALLEALDPEQNKAFEDHYLDLPLDLSQVIFITTANTLETIPPALRDRLEIIRYSGYTEEEKLHIAQDHLWSKQLKANALKTTDVVVGTDEMNHIIRRYTREAGVRELERTIGKVLRKIARTIVEESRKEKTHKVSIKDIQEYLGPEMFDVTLAEESDPVGMATGLAWTSVGGDVLFIEVALTPGKGEVRLTGKLGDVMKESAQTALTYVKSHAVELGIDQKKLETTNVHIHIPEGAVPKDGPSAGVTLTTAIVSAFTNKAVRRDLAMTGEVTLRGRVLRIGGLKEKSIAAHRAGIKTVLIPQENARDLVDIPDSVKKEVVFIPVTDVATVLKHALLTPGRKRTNQPTTKKVGKKSV